MKKNLYKVIICVSMILISCIGLTGCSSEDSIVGTWVTVDEKHEEKMRFYEDGTCLDVPYRTHTSADVESYKKQEDGMIIFTMEWDGTITLEPTDDEEKALKDDDYYYLSGDKLIMKKKTYERQE